MVDIANSMSVKSILIGDGEVPHGDKFLSNGDGDREERVVRVSNDLKKI